MEGKIDSSITYRVGLINGAPKEYMNKRNGRLVHKKLRCLKIIGVLGFFLIVLSMFLIVMLGGFP